jgi:3D (Asp-Asp-Asp) domain-containing protein
VTIVADGRSRELPTTSGNVSSALDEAGIALGPMDRVSPALDTALSDGIEVRVTRVSRRHVDEEVAVPSRTVLLGDPELPAGYTQVLEHGQDGRVRRTTRIWEKDGQVTKKEVIKERSLAKATDTVVLRGTRGLSSRGGNWRDPVRMHATAYDPGPRSCGKYADGYTAIGVKARKGVVAVDDRVIPMRTRLYIPGYGFAVAADRGSAIKGNRIDLCFNTYAEAKRWGRRKIKVYLLN